MTKPLKVARWVVPVDLQAIYDYHRQFSAAKAERMVVEYDRIVALLEMNPLLFHRRKDDWRVYPFDSGTYLLYYRELEEYWLIVGLFHALRDPNWIRRKLASRESERTG